MELGPQALAGGLSILGLWYQKIQMPSPLIFDSTCRGTTRAALSRAIALVSTQLPGTTLWMAPAIFFIVICYAGSIEHSTGLLNRITRSAPSGRTEGRGRFTTGILCSQWVAQLSLHRLYAGKTEVRINDYVDREVTCSLS